MKDAPEYGILTGVNLPPLRARRRWLLLVAAALLLFVTNCARTPATNTGTNRAKTLVATIRFRGPIDINKQPTGNYYYVVINRTNTRTDPGPVPVVAPPWGNGFAAPSQDGAQGFVGMVRYSRDVATTNGYEVDRSTDASGNLVLPVTNQFVNLGPPDFAQDVPSGSDTLSFRLDLSRLPNPTARYIQLNIIATNRVPQGVEDTSKYWDAIGDGRETGSVNAPITIDTTQNQIIRNSDQIAPINEPSGDVRDRLLPNTVDDSSLDIIDWTFEIRDS